jgi:hypothetical protein
MLWVDEDGRWVESGLGSGEAEVRTGVERREVTCVCDSSAVFDVLE